MMSAKTVVLLIQNILTKKFIHFNPSTRQVELQEDKFSKGMFLSCVYAQLQHAATILLIDLFTDNFILNDKTIGQTHQHIIQVFSSPSTVLHVSGDAHLSLRDGASDVMVLPPDNDTGVMLYIEVASYSCIQVRLCYCFY